MKKKLLAIFTAILMVVAMIPMFAFPALAKYTDSGHTLDLEITKNGEPAVLHTDTITGDYSFDTGDGTITILTSGLTVSGETDDNHIVVSEGVTKLTLEGVIIDFVGPNPVYIPAGEAFTLTVNGKNTLKTSSMSKHCISSLRDLEIDGNGELNLTTNYTYSDGICSYGTLTINMDGGTIVAKINYWTSYGISANELKINAVKKLLVRGNGGAIECKSNSGPAIASLAEGLIITGSTVFDTKQSPITDEVDYKTNKYVVIKGKTDVAKSVLIQKKYKMKNGENQEIDLTNIKDAVFASEAKFEDNFIGVKVDGEDVAPGNFTAVSGSTIVTLKADYLKTLKTGKHEIKIISGDGIAIAEFSVIKTTPKEDTPKTADTNSTLLWIVIALAGLVGISGIVLRVKRTDR